jgi:hypothetical protein
MHLAWGKPTSRAAIIKAGSQAKEPLTKFQGFFLKIPFPLSRPAEFHHHISRRNQ